MKVNFTSNPTIDHRKYRKDFREHLSENLMSDYAPTVRQNVTLIRKQDNSVNKNAKKTAELNFSGLSASTSEVTAKAGKTLAQKITKNKYFLKFLELAKDNSAVFEALVSLFITCGLRPLTIMAIPSNDKERNKKAASHSISSGVLGYIFALALFTPLSKGVKAISANPQKYLGKGTEYLKDAGKKVTESKNYKAFEMLGGYLPKLVFSPLTAAVTIALIPVIDKYIIHKLFPKEQAKTPTGQSISNPYYAYTVVNFKSLPERNKKVFQNFTGVNK